MAESAQIFEALLVSQRAAGATLANGKAYFYEPGTTTLKTIYADRNQTTPAANPYTLSADGTAQVYGLGLYDVKITNAANVQKYYWEDVYLSADSSPFVLLSDYDSINDAITTIGSTPTTLFIDTSLATTSTTTTFPTTLHLQFINGGVITVGTGKTLNIYGSFTAGRYQIFAGSGTINFATSSTEAAFPEWWGAKADGLDASATANTTAIHKALATGLPVYLASGEYVHTGLTINDTSNNYTVLRGAGMRNTKLTCNTTSAHNIKLTSVSTFLLNVQISDLSIRGNALNGSGIFMDGAAQYVIERVFIYNNGRHGIETTGIGAPSYGVYSGVIQDSVISGSVLDGIFMVANSGNNQQNANLIMKNEITANKRNGISAYGLNISINYNQIEGNYKYGVQLENMVSGVYNAINIFINGNYFELNKYGNIYTKTGAAVGYIKGLTIRDNYMHVSPENAFSDPTLFNFKADTTEYLGGAQIVGLIWENNTVDVTRALGEQDADLHADFGKLLNSGSIVRVPYSITTVADIVKYQGKYANVGTGELIIAKSQTIQGYFAAKGGSGIAYSTIKQSDNITVADSQTNFPLLIPMGLSIIGITIPVDTDYTAWALQMDTLYRPYDTIDDYASRSYRYPGAVTFHSGSALVEMPGDAYFDSNNPRNLDTTDTYLRITFRKDAGNTGTYFKLGNPTVYYK